MQAAAVMRLSFCAGSHKFQYNTVRHTLQAFVLILGAFTMIQPI